jgi:hypothetical protein
MQNVGKTENLISTLDLELIEIERQVASVVKE